MQQPEEEACCPERLAWRQDLNRALARAVSPVLLGEVRKVFSRGRPEWCAAELEVAVPQSAALPTTPLCWAIRQGRLGLVELLLELGADPNRREPAEPGSLSNYPIHLAVQQTSVSCIKALLEAKADPSLHAANGSNALHMAAVLGTVKTMGEILDRYPELLESMAWVPPRFTPLQLCIYPKPQIEKIRFLLDAGARINPEPPAPLPPEAEERAALYSELLLDSPQRPQSSVSLACSMIKVFSEQAKCEALQLILDAGGHLEISGPDSPLLSPGLPRHPLLVKMLLDEGCDPNCENEDGFKMITTIDLDVHDPPCVESFEWLLLAKADPDALYPDGRSLLTRAITNSAHKNLAVILLQHGADPNARDGRGRTPLEVVRAEGICEDWGIVAALMQHGAELILPRVPEDCDALGLAMSAASETAWDHLLNRVEAAGFDLHSMLGQVGECGSNPIDLASNFSLQATIRLAQAGLGRFRFPCRLEGASCWVVSCCERWAQAAGMITPRRSPELRGIACLSPEPEDSSRDDRSADSEALR